MSESQLDRVASWRKGYRELLELPGLSLLEAHLLMTIERRGMRDLEHLVGGQPRPDVGWSVRRDERPDTRRELAALCRLPAGAAGVAELDAAITGLVELGHIIVADDGAVGMVGWAEMQESPDAARKRGARRSERGQASDESGRPADAVRTNPKQSVECPPQRTEDRGQRIDSGGGAPRGRARTLGQHLRLAREGGASPMTEAALAKGLGLDVATVRAFEADEQVPTRHELRAIAGVLREPDIADLELPDRDPSVVAYVAQLLRKHELELGIVGPDHPQPKVDGAVARWVFTPGGTAEELLAGWRRVISRGAEKIRREVERGAGGDSASWFTLQHLSKPKIWREYLDKHDLDHRRDCSPKAARASPRGLRGPPPPQNDDLPPNVREG